MFGRNKFIVMEHEAGLLFHEGKLIETLAPGKYVRWGADYKVEVYDARLSQMSIPNQEIACADGVSLRASATVNYKIVDVEKAYRSSKQIYTYIYELAHDALREALGSMTVDEAMAKRSEHSVRLTDLIQPKATEVGVEVSSCSVRDLSVAGEIKRAYGQLIVAQKEAEAALERARGETAALRSLANAARLMDSNPNLLQLRWIHALGQAKGATIVLSPSGMIPVAGNDSANQ